MRALGWKGRVLSAALLLLLAAGSFWAALNQRDLPQTETAAAYAREISVAASATYITLRTLNAFLSSAQEIEVGVAFLGQASAQPLKVLEPIDDTVERIAGVVFWVMMISGVLAVSMGPFGAVGFAVLGVASLLAAGALASGRGLAIPRMLALQGGFLAIAIPLAFIASGLLADWMVQGTWDEHSRIVAEITATVDEVEPSSGLRAMLDQMDRYQTLAENLSSRADELVGSLIALLSIYLFKMVVLPVLLIGVLFVAARRLAGPPCRFSGCSAPPASSARQPPTR